MIRFRIPLILVAGGFAANGAALIVYRLFHHGDGTGPVAAPWSHPGT
ncbi:MAG: hypothetical protein ACLQPN_09310 [Bryobacteraceae bacterium]